jgi:hypothetical protein
MSSSKGKLVLKRHKKTDKLYHPESSLVFKSATEKLVIGRMDGDEFISLDDETLDLCEKHQFKYDESLVETVSENEQVSEVVNDVVNETVNETVN